MRSITHAIERRFIALIIGTMWVVAQSSGLAGQAEAPAELRSLPEGTRELVEGHEPGMVRVTVEVELSCPSCAMGLERRLGRLEHVAAVDVRPADGRIVLAVEPGRCLDLAAVRGTVRNVGFVPHGAAVIAVGHLIDVDGAPALALAPACVLPLAVEVPTAALASEAAGRLLEVSGRWNDPSDGPGRLQVESLAAR